MVNPLLAIVPDGPREFERRNSFHSDKDVNDNHGANESMAEVDGGWSSDGLEDEALPPLPKIGVDTNQNASQWKMNVKKLIVNNKE